MILEELDDILELLWLVTLSDLLVKHAGNLLKALSLIVVPVLGTHMHTCIHIHVCSPLSSCQSSVHALRTSL